MTALLQVEDLRISFKPRGRAREVVAVRGASFEVKEGTLCALVGESGCGKSVTAKAIMGLVRRPGRVLPGSKILFDGEDLTAFDDRRWNAFRGAQASMVFQDALVSLNPTMKVKRQIVESLDNHEPGLTEAEKRRRALEMLELTQVPDPDGCLEKYPHELSGGMRQRVMIASAMISRPKLLIADEPTTSLDVTIQAQTLALMKDLQERMGTAILLITHDLGIVADVADEVVVMYAGQVVEKGGCRDVFYNPAHPYTRALQGCVPRMDARGGESLKVIEGTLPDLSAPVPGCAFCDRCDHAMRVCAQVPPQVSDLGGGHEASCWMCDPRCDARKGEDRG